VGYLDTWGIFHDPEVDKWAVVKWRAEDGKLTAYPPRVADSLDAARALVPIERLGLVRFLPTPGEDSPELVESWV
jgi:hypothetical protein